MEQAPNSGLEKVLRFAQQQTDTVRIEPSRDELRMLVQAAQAALIEACTTSDPEAAATLVYAAAGVVEDLAGSFATDELEDWVELTSAPCDSDILLAGAAEPYGSVPYADPGYLGKKRYPIDEKHVKAAWSYINQAKNAARYTAVQLSHIKGKIKAAMKKHGHGANIDATHPGDSTISLAGAGTTAGHSAMTGTHSHEHSHAGTAHDSATGPSKGLDAAAAGTRRSDTGQSAAAASSNNMSFSVLSQLRDGMIYLAAPPGDVPMHHGPMTGTHEHPHAVTLVHGHAHSHQDDNQHGSPVHGNNAKEKAWAAKGQSNHRDW